MNEAYLKKRLREALAEVMPDCVVIRHEDKFSAGVPDLSVTWAGRTAWVEVKYARTGRPARTTALQDLMLKRLASAGAPALLVTYAEPRRGQPGRATRVVRYAGEETGWALASDQYDPASAAGVQMLGGAETLDGFDHQGVAFRVARALCETPSANEEFEK